MYDATLAETISFAGSGGDVIEGYLARPMRPGPVGSVVVIHHMPGFDAATKEITRRFAANGYAAVMPEPVLPRGAGRRPRRRGRHRAGARAASRTSGSSAMSQAAAAYLRALAGANGKVGVIGYCSGGRQAFLAAVQPGLDAAVDCYGAFVFGTPPEEFPLPVTPLLDLVPQLCCPLLGLFGGEDKYPSPEHVEELEAALEQAGKPYEFHSYDDAGHGFFAVDRPMYRQAAATDGWSRSGTSSAAPA